MDIFLDFSDVIRYKYLNYMFTEREMKRFSLALKSNMETNLSGRYNVTCCNIVAQKDQRSASMWPRL